MGSFFYFSLTGKNLYENLKTKKNEKNFLKKKKKI
jgi:hypothetical protein